VYVHDLWDTLKLMINTILVYLVGMPQNCSPRLGTNRCDHSKLSSASTAHAYEVGYSRPNSERRAAATTLQRTIKSLPQGKKNRSAIEESETSFPAPLILPEDDLALDPQYPAQSLRSWNRLKGRNEVTPDRRTIYVAAPPDIARDVLFIREWTNPKQGVSSVTKTAIVAPGIQDVTSYLEAFYHGLPVKSLRSLKLCFTAWDDCNPRKAKAKPKTQQFIGLKTSSEYIGIRTRSTSNGDFSHQLNLNDLLDVAISVLPDDAHALLLLVEHDLYEEDDDVFVCGRAYGGSRVAVVSTARYCPALDQKQGLEAERQHAWPASHCTAYLQKLYVTSTRETKRRKVDSTARQSNSDKPLEAAVSAHHALPSFDSSPSLTTLANLWFGRVCRTASHELGHCFGIDHCVYYACVMQGSASIIEDTRQPPYLCPVDLAKVLQSTGTDAKQRYQALLNFCDKYKDTHLFAAYGAWIRGRLAVLPEQGS
jgi:archaemetzincin